MRQAILMGHNGLPSQSHSAAIRCWWRRYIMKMCEARYKDLQFWGKPSKPIEGHRPNQLEQLESFHLPSSTKSNHGKIMASLLEQWLLNLGDRPPKTVRIILKLIINQQSFISYTSSAAQGGGGSFKNRKPIGEACCCGAKMAERTHWWIESWLCVSAFWSAVARTKPAAATPWGRHVGGMGRVTFLHVFLYFWRHDGARQHSGSRRFLSAVARTKLPRHREADTSEGWVTFLHVFLYDHNRGLYHCMLAVFLILYRRLW